MIYEKYFLFRPPNTYRDDACDSCSDYIKLLAINYNMYSEREKGGWVGGIDLAYKLLYLHSCYLITEYHFLTIKSLHFLEIIKAEV